MTGVQDSSVVAFKRGNPRRTSSNPGQVFFLLLSLEKKYTYMCVKCPEPARVGSGRQGSLLKSPLWPFQSRETIPLTFYRYLARTLFMIFVHKAWTAWYTKIYDNVMWGLPIFCKTIFFLFMNLRAQGRTECFTPRPCPLLCYYPGLGNFTSKFFWASF
jgi:hypothetical protein